jgi:tellurite resistance protein TerA
MNNLSKITIEKSGDSHLIDFSNVTVMPKGIIINMDWNQPTAIKKTNFLSNFLSKIKSFFGIKRGTDLDLGCFYELNNGRRQVIDALQFAGRHGGPRDQQTKQGCFTTTPYIWHSGDNRGNTDYSEENIFINTSGITVIKRIIIYCCVYHGKVDWKSSEAILTIKIKGYSDVVVEIGKQSCNKRFCVAAELIFTQKTVRIIKHETFHDNYKDCDNAYNWNMVWKGGTK